VSAAAPAAAAESRSDCRRVSAEVLGHTTPFFMRGNGKSFLYSGK
jgi:hypothetical protein